MNRNSSGGIGVCWILTIVFMVLKLTGYIDWSWWWVTCPVWGMIAVCVILIGIGSILQRIVK